MSASKGKNKLADATGTRQRLLEAARAEFGERGLEAATTRGIAARAGCNEVTLFRHFETKQKLLAASVRETSGEFRQLCECAGGFSGDLVEDLGRFARVYNESLESCEGMARALIGEGKRRPALVNELIGDVLEPFHRSIAGYLESRKADGAVRQDVDTLACAEILTSALLGGMLRRTSGLSALGRDAWVGQMTALLAAAVAGKHWIPNTKFETTDGERARE